MPAINDTAYALKLYPGTDLKNSIQNFVKERNIPARWIVNCAGSLTEYSIRFAHQSEASKDTRYFEIVSLTGMISLNGIHLHISISDHTGKTIGGACHRRL